MDKSKSKKKGISTDVNWLVFWLSVAIYLASFLFNLMQIVSLNKIQASLATKDAQMVGYGIMIPLLAMLGLFHYLCNYVRCTVPLTLIILGNLSCLTVALPLAGFYSVPLPLLLYAWSISIAHLFEYLFVCGYHPEELSWKSFLIDQSKAYVGAHCFAMLEYAVELLLVPEWCKFKVASIPALGFGMVMVGHFFRIGAMFTAASNFHHIVQTEKAQGHKLVTSGVYQVVRHPSYFGWTLWAVGTQVMLMNPISIVGFTYAAYLFFSDRIPEEEMLLVEFFGDAYIKYALKTPILIPGVQSAIREVPEEEVEGSKRR